jgi:branched-chain amino acid aminotransferase
MPWDDHLVHRGDGVFETIKYIDGKMYQLEAHLDRMETSAKGIYLSLPCPRDEIREHILDTARAGGSDIGLVRVLLGRGPGGFGVDPFECPVPSLYIVAYKFTPKPENLFENGVTAFKTSIPAKQPWLAKIKSLDYLPNALMKREAEEKGFTFPLCFDAHGFLAEGATENVCIVDKQGRLIAPEFTSALRGTTLLRAVDLIKHEIPISFRGVTEGELFEAKEVIVIGTTLDAISVIRYEGKPIHDVRPGPVSKRIRELLKKDLQENGTPL